MDKEKVQAFLDASPADFDVDQFLEQVCLLKSIDRGKVMSPRHVLLITTP